MSRAAMQTVDVEAATRSSEAALARWREHGYVVIPRLFSPERVGRLRPICERILAQWRARDPQSGQAAATHATVMRHLNHPAYFRDHPADFPPLMDAIADPAVLAIARSLFQDEPVFRCTSLWMNPATDGRDGNWHRDSQFTVASEEEERVTLSQQGARAQSAQIQIALAPSDDVEIVPGSHLRWDTDGEYAIRRADNQKNSQSNLMPGAVRMALRPGDGLMFNSYALHRGRYHRDRLRRTFMLTYSSPGSMRYDTFTDQQWFLEPGHLDTLAPRTRALFERFIALFKPHWLDPARQLAKT
jgi:ectoine hydroxylase-related dioxygenase (phytanoyl-CoA dioxygenase family)